MPPPLLPALVAALIQLTGAPLSGGVVSGSASLRLERALGGDTPVLTLASPLGLVRLLVDSGASSTMVTPELARRLGLASQALARGEIELAGGGARCAALRPRRTRLPDLQLASGEQQCSLRLSGVEALVMPVAALPEGVDGVLGSPSLRQLPLWIDPRRQRLALGAAALKAAQVEDSPAASSRLPAARLGVAGAAEPQVPDGWGSEPLGHGAQSGVSRDRGSAAGAGAAAVAGPLSPRLVIPLRWHRGVPLLELHSPGGPVAALADTGAEGLFISAALAARLQPIGPAQPLKLAGFCGEQAVELRRYGGLSLGAAGRAAERSAGSAPGQPTAVEAIRIENPIFAQLGVEAIVGQELLRRRSQLWRLESHPPRLELR